jgi:hypothetical protein
MKKRVPSPALVISFIALVVALSATAYAATSISSSKQIKNNIITGSDIKNRSISGTDLKKDTVKVNNLAKSTLKRIDGGPTGGPTVTEVTREGPKNVAPQNKNVEVVSMTLPKGSYVIQAKVIQRALPPPTNQLLQPNIPVATGNCKLDAAGDIDDSVETIVVDSRSATGAHVLQITRGLGNNSVIKVTCDSNYRWSAAFVSLIAQRVGSVSKTDVPE